MNSYGLDLGPCRVAGCGPSKQPLRLPGTSAYDLSWPLCAGSTIPSFLRLQPLSITWRGIWCTRPKARDLPDAHLQFELRRVEGGHYAGPEATDRPKWARCNWRSCTFNYD